MRRVCFVFLCSRWSGGRVCGCFFPFFPLLPSHQPMLRVSLARVAARVFFAMPPKRAAALKAKYHESSEEESEFAPSSASEDERPRKKPAAAAVKKQKAEPGAAVKKKKKTEKVEVPKQKVEAPPISEGWHSLHTAGWPYIMYKCVSTRGVFGWRGFLLLFFRRRAPSLCTSRTPRPLTPTHNTTTGGTARPPTRARWPPLTWCVFARAEGEGS